MCREERDGQIRLELNEEKLLAEVELKELSNSRKQRLVSLNLPENKQGVASQSSE